MRLPARIVKTLLGDNIHLFFRDIRDVLSYWLKCQLIKPRLFCNWFMARNLRSSLIVPNLTNPNVIVSFTSFKDRVCLSGVVECVVLSLLKQTKKADAVILWLAKEEFPNGLSDLPKGLVNLQRIGLTILFCEQMKSYKKLLPTLRSWPNSTVITADDDVYYPKHWLAGLLEKHRQSPNDIVAYCGRRVLLSDENGFAAYSAWTTQGFRGTSFLNLPTGVGGVLYPPHAWSRMILDYELAKKLAPFGDDLFFHLCCVLANSRVTAIDLCGKLIDLIPNVDAAPHLCSENIGRMRNDTALRAIAELFPSYYELLENEQKMVLPQSYAHCSHDFQMEMPI